MFLTYIKQEIELWSTDTNFLCSDIFKEHVALILKVGLGDESDTFLRNVEDP